MTSQTSPFRRATWDGMSSGVDFLNPFSSEAQETIPVWDALDLSPGKWMLRNHWTSKKNREQKLHMMKKMGNCESAEEGVGYCNYGPISFWRYLFVLGNRTDIIIIPNSPIIIIIEFEVRV